MITVEEKAKAYDGLIERLKDLKFAYRFSPLSDTIEEKFPEINDNRDEKIIKSFIRLLNAFHDVNFPTPEGFERKDMIAWIKKQGNQKDSYTKQQLRDMGFAFTLNGDIVTPEKTNEAIKEYLANEKKKWEVEQKPIEYNTDKIIDIQLNDYCCKIYNSLHKENGGLLSFARLQHLAMDIQKWCKEQSKQEWSEEDELRLNTICDILVGLDEQRNWLKCLKDRVQPKPIEWSEEDNLQLEFCCAAIEMSDFSNVDYRTQAITWLNLLKDRIQANNLTVTDE